MGAAEWFVTSVSSLMSLQDTLLCECFVTIAARESCIKSLHGYTMIVRIGLRCNVFTRYYVCRLVYLSF